MGTNRKLSEGLGFQALIDALRNGPTNFNPASKGCVAGQNSLVHPALSTAGSLIVDGKHIATVAASSTFFALEVNSVPAYGAVNYVLCINAAGSGIGYATNVLTSAQVSALGAIANVQADFSYTTWPTIPTTMTPVGLYTVIAGSASHIAGSNTFSTATSLTGSHLFTDIASYNKNV